jgi:ATP-dependent RNA helicase RhlE
MSKGFNTFELSPALQRGIADRGYVEPRPIQAQTIPAVLEGRDVLGLAQTGTGKTAAFALPLLQRLLGGRRPGPRVLVLAPTRELATQITEEFKALAGFTRIKVAVVFGGVSQRSQINALNADPEIVVACPGRLLDLLGQNLLRLDRVEALVLDEADHMFDMGFLPDIRRILEQLPERRQTLLFSATMPKEIRRLADRQLRDPHVVELDHTRPLETISHALYPIVDTQKLPLLERLIEDDGIASAIVFTRTKHRAKRLAQKLSRSGYRAVALQGNMSQNARVRAMDGFRQREFDILVATDIAARGIDVEKVSHVVNFDMPNTPEAYTHRIGRTGRAEREGKAYTFVTADDSEMVRAVERRLGSPIPRHSVDGIESIAFPVASSDRGRPGHRGSANRVAAPAGRRGPGRKAAAGPPRRRRRPGGSSSAGRRRSA